MRTRALVDAKPLTVNNTYVHLIRSLKSVRLRLRGSNGSGVNMISRSHGRGRRTLANLIDLGDKNQVKTEISRILHHVLDTQKLPEPSFLWNRYNLIVRHRANAK